jgi:hypothetical protein
MTVKELIIKLLEEDMDAEVLVSIDKVHYNKHGRCEGYSFNIDSVNYEYGACMIKFKDPCGVLERGEGYDGNGRLSGTS